MAPSAVVLILALVGCVLWALAVGVVSVSGWADTEAAIAAERDTGQSFCGGRYPEPTAKARCEDLFQVQYVTSRNIAIATRILIALLPFAGVTIWQWWIRPTRVKP